MEKQPTYETAYRELLLITKEIESGNIGIDELLEKVKRAEELIVICKEKLKVTEQEVDEILKKLSEEEHL